jgi:hypothetical protein
MRVENDEASHRLTPINTDYLIGHSLKLNPALSPAKLECRAEDVMRDRILPLVFAGIEFICVHLCQSVAQFGLDSTWMRPCGSYWDLMGATAKKNQMELAGVMSPWKPLGRALDKSKAVQSNPKQSEAVQTKQKKYIKILFSVLSVCSCFIKKSQTGGNGDNGGRSAKPASIRADTTCWDLLGPYGTCSDLLGAMAKKNK